MGEVNLDNVNDLKKALVRLTRERDAAVKEARELSRAIQNMGQPPLVVAQVKQVLSKNFAIVRTPNYQEFLVPHPNFDLLVGNRVALNQNTYAIVKILPPLTEGDVQAKPDALKEDQVLDQPVNVILTISLGLLQCAAYLASSEGLSPKEYFEKVLETQINWRHLPSKSTQ